MTRTTYPVAAAPAAGGPYSHNARVGQVVATAGQCGYLPDRSLVADLEGQVRQAMANLVAALGAAGATEADVVSIQVYLANADDFAAMNAVYAAFLSEPLPPRTTVVAGLRPGVLFEVSALAVVEG